jgi:hypothetical protein
VPDEEGPPPYEVLAALVVSLRRELAEAQEELGRGKGAGCRAGGAAGPVAQELFEAALQRGAGEAAAPEEVAAEEERPAAGRAGRV